MIFYERNIEKRKKEREKEGREGRKEGRIKREGRSKEGQK